MTRVKRLLSTDWRVRYTGVGAVACLLAVLMTWPAATHFDSTVLGSPGDVPNGIRVLWSLHAQHGNPFTTSQDFLINAPDGVPVSRAVYIANAIFQGFWWFGGLIVGWIPAYNIYDLLAWVAAAVGAFALFDRLRFGTLPAVFGAYVFAFNPNHVEKVYSSAPLAATGVLPLLLLTLFVNRRTPRRRRASAVGLLVLVAFYLDSYLGLLALGVAAVFIVVHLVVPPAGSRVSDVARSYYFALLVFVIGTGPIAWSWSGDAGTVSALASTRAIPLQGGFASPQLYLLPGPRNPWFGGPMRSWLGFHLAWEGTMFFGYTTLVLACLGIVIGISKRRAAALDRETAVYLLVGSGLVLAGVWASLPPTIPIGGGLHLPVLQQVLYHLTKLFRVFARFGVVAGLGELMLAVYALSSIRRVLVGRMVCVLAVALVAIELYVPKPIFTSVRDDVTAITTREVGASLSGPPVLLSLTNPPDYVRWLADHPGGTVADYPRPENPAGRWEWKNAYQQTHHHHPLWQVTSTSAAEQDLTGEKHAAANIDQALSPAILGVGGVRFVVVHADQYRALGEPVPNPARRCGLLRVARFPASSVVIYRVANSHPEGWIIPAVGFDSIANKKLWPESDGFLWMGDTARFTIFSPHAGQVSISAPAVSLRESRELEVFDVQGGKLGVWTISTNETTFNIPLQVGPGLNEFVFRVKPGARVRGDGDNRRVSVAMRPFAVRWADGSRFGSGLGSGSCSAGS